MVKQVTLTQLEGGYLFQRNPGLTSIHPNFGHALKAIREFLEEEKGNSGLKAVPSSPEMAQVNIVEE